MTFEPEEHIKASLPKKLTVSLLSTIFILLVIELIARLMSGNWTESFLERKLNLMHGAYPAVYDAELGWTPEPNYSGQANAWKTEVTITGEGFRSNGSDRPSNNPFRILAVGDSFTFGDEVSDNETWPAHLQRILKTEVINAGVFGYGLDQTILRTRKLVPSLKPDWVIVSFIPDDVRRCGMDMSAGAFKPYFVRDKRRLEVRNQPVPLPKSLPMDSFRKIFGYSWIAHSIMKQVNREYWYQGESAYSRAHNDGIEVGKILLFSLAELEKVYGTRILVVVQYGEAIMDEPHDLVTAVTKRIRKKGFMIIDLYDTLVKKNKENEEEFKSFYHGHGHMSDLGNRFVAENIAQYLRAKEERLTK